MPPSEHGSAEPKVCQRKAGGRSFSPGDRSNMETADQDGDFIECILFGFVQSPDLADAYA